MIVYDLTWINNTQNVTPNNMPTHHKYINLMYISNQCCVIIIHLIIPIQDNTPVDEKELCETWSQCKCKTVKMEIGYPVSDQ